MQCPTCHMQTDCIDSREKDFTRIRRYKCECGFKFSTVELIQDINNLVSITEMAQNRKLSGIRSKWVEAGKQIARKEIKELLGENI
jgi:transcriptional regulator NrdR family protein